MGISSCTTWKKRSQIGFYQWLQVDKDTACFCLRNMPKERALKRSLDVKALVLEYLWGYIARDCDFFFHQIFMGIRHPANPEDCSLFFLSRKDCENNNFGFATVFQKLLSRSWKRSHCWMSRLSVLWVPLKVFFLYRQTQKLVWCVKSYITNHCRSPLGLGSLRGRTPDAGPASDILWQRLWCP